MAQLEVPRLHTWHYNTTLTKPTAQTVHCKCILGLTYTSHWKGSVAHTDTLSLTLAIHEFRINSLLKQRNTLQPSTTIKPNKGRHVILTYYYIHDNWRYHISLHYDTDDTRKIPRTNDTDALLARCHTDTSYSLYNKYETDGTGYAKIIKKTNQVKWSDEFDINSWLSIHNN